MDNLLNDLKVNINDEIFSLVLHSSIEGRKHCRKKFIFMDCYTIDILHISGHYLHTRMIQKRKHFIVYDT